MTQPTQSQQQSTALQDTATAVIAAGSKTPFSTAFKITLGIGLARLSLFVAGLAVIAGIVGVYHMVAK